MSDEPAFSPNVRANVEVLEAHASDTAQQEIDRMGTLDTKASALIAAGLVLVAAGVAFAAALTSVGGSSGAHRLWAILLVVVLLFLSASIVSATYASRPQPARIVIDIDELARWATPRFLDRDPTRVRGELMQASIAAVGAARAINHKKGRWLTAAFGFFAAAMVATVALGSAVAVHSVESHQHHGRRRPATGAHAGGRRERAGRRADASA